MFPELLRIPLASARSKKKRNEKNEYYVIKLKLTKLFCPPDDAQRVFKESKLKIALKFLKSRC